MAPLKTALMVVSSAAAAFRGKAARSTGATRLRKVLTSSLEIGYEETGREAGDPIFLLHGWPYHPRTFDGVIQPLVHAGHRVIVPYARGFGPTTYRSATTFRSGEQAALGKDLLDLMDALGITRATLVGYDWGNRAACVVAALWPARVHAFVCMPGYLIIDRKAESKNPGPPESIRQTWYRWFMNSPQGAGYLEKDRAGLARQCWEAWSPDWEFSPALYKESAKAFENPGWLETTLHCYRHWYANAAGNPAYQTIEARLAAKPKITVPTIALAGDSDPLQPIATVKAKDKQFSGRFERRTLKGVGHCPPAEAAKEVVTAISDAHRLGARA